MPFIDAIVKKSTVTTRFPLEFMQQQLLEKFSSLLQYLEAYQILMHQHLSMPPIKVHLALFFKISKQLIELQLKIIVVIEKLGTTHALCWVTFDTSTQLINYQARAKSLKTIKTQKTKDNFLYQSNKLDEFMSVIEFLATQHSLLSTTTLLTKHSRPVVEKQLNNLFKNPALTTSKELEILILHLIENINLTSVLYIFNDILEYSDYGTIHNIVLSYLYDDYEGELIEHLTVTDALQSSFSGSSINVLANFYKVLEARIASFQKIVKLIQDSERSHFSRNFEGLLRLNDTILDIIIINQKLFLSLAIFINKYPAAIDDITQQQISLLQLQLKLLKYLKSRGIKCVVMWPILGHDEVRMLDKAEMVPPSAAKGDNTVGFDLDDIIAKQAKLVLILKGTQLDRQIGWNLPAANYTTMMQREQLRVDKHYQQLMQLEGAISEAAAQKALLAKERDAKRRQEAFCLQATKQKTVPKPELATVTSTSVKQSTAPVPADPLASLCDSLAQAVNLFFKTAQEPKELLNELQQVKQNAALQEHLEVSIRVQVLLAEYYQIKGHHLTLGDKFNEAIITFFDAALTHFKIAHSELDIYPKESSFYLNYNNIITLCIDKQKQLLVDTQKAYETQMKKASVKVSEIEHDILRLEQRRDYLKYHVYGTENWKKNKGDSPATKRRLHLEDQLLQFLTKDYPKADRRLLSIIYLVKVHQQYLNLHKVTPKSSFHYSFEVPKTSKKATYLRPSSTLATSSSSTASSTAVFATSSITSSPVFTSKNPNLPTMKPALRLPQKPIVLRDNPPTPNFKS